MPRISCERYTGQNTNDMSIIPFQPLKLKPNQKEYSDDRGRPALCRDRWPCPNDRGEHRTTANTHEQRSGEGPACTMATETANTESGQHTLHDRTRLIT